MAENRGKELGGGNARKEKGVYSPDVRGALKLEEKDIPPLKEKLRETIVEEVNKQVEQYLQ